eukprot:6039785-Amphidinium_carterae.1
MNGPYHNVLERAWQGATENLERSLSNRSTGVGGDAVQSTVLSKPELLLLQVWTWKCQRHHG